MTMKDLSTGPDWIVWGVFVALITISATLLSGHGQIRADYGKCCAI